MESERTVRLSPGHLVRVKHTGEIGVVAWVDRDRLEEPWVMLGVWVLERASQLVRRRIPAVDVEPADPDTLAEVAVEGADSLKRFQWDVGSGDAVRFAATGEVGVVADVGPGTAMVWVLEWARLKVPRLVRRQCAVDGIGLATIAGHELVPSTPAVPEPTRRCKALVIDELGRVVRWQPVDCPVAFSMSGPPQLRECTPMMCRRVPLPRQAGCLMTCAHAVRYDDLLSCERAKDLGALELLGRILFDGRKPRERVEAEFDADGMVAVGATDAQLRRRLGLDPVGPTPVNYDLAAGEAARPVATVVVSADPEDKLVPALVVLLDGRLRRFEPPVAVGTGGKPLASGVGLMDCPCPVPGREDFCHVRCPHLKCRGDAGIVRCDVMSWEGRIVEDDLRDWAAPQVTMDDQGRVPAEPKPLRVQALWIDATGEVQRDPPGGKRRPLPCPVGALEGVLKRPVCTSTCVGAHRVPLLPRGGLLRCDSYLTGQLLGRIVEDAVGLGWKDGVEPDAAGLVPVEAAAAEVVDAPAAPPRVMALAIAEDGRRVGRIRHQATDPAWVAEMRRRGVSELRHVGPFAVEPLLCQRGAPAEACVLACTHLLRMGDHCECRALGWRGLILSDGSTGWRRYDLWVGADDLVEAPGWPVYLKGKEEGA